MRVNGDVIGLDHVLKNGDLIEHHIHRCVHDTFAAVCLVVFRPYSGSMYLFCDSMWTVL